MWSQRITWTALPWGHDRRDRPRLSAFASLRLDPGPDDPPRLSSFPDIEAWPELVARTTFGAVVEIEGQPSRELATAVVSAAPDSTVFGAVLPGTSPVTAFAFVDQSGRPVVSYSVHDVLVAMHDLYGSVGAEDPERLPQATWTGGRGGARTPMDSLLGEVGGLLGVAPAPRELPEAEPSEHDRERTPGAHEQLRRRYGPARLYGSQPAAVDDPEGSGLSGRALELARAWRFHHRPETRAGDQHLAEPDPQWVAPPVSQPEIDVHGALGLLADHPLLLRRLGLVVDLALLGDVPDGPFRVRLVARYADPQPDPRTAHHGPWSRVVRRAPLFVAADGGDVVAGQLDLSGARAPESAAGDFDVVQVDPDGAALRLVNAASTMRALAVGAELGYASYDTPKEGSLPTLRSAGLAIVRTGRTQAMQDRIAASKAADDAAEADLAAPPGMPPQTELDAGQLVRGLRVDVARRRRGTQKWSPWLSLHRRTSSWRVGGQELGGDTGAGPPEYSGEGALRATSATSVEESDAIYLHESVARWAGWSLSVPRPARIARAKDLPGGRQLEVVELAGDPAPHEDFPFVATSHLIEGDGTLPALRFGDAYRLRVRAVDLAGNALTPEAADEGLASPEVELLRWEPIPAPDLVARKAFWEGASLLRMVIRSDAGVPAAKYGATGRVESLDDRYALAPPTSVGMAETHGRLDKPDGTPDPGAYGVAKREGALLRGEQPPWQQVVAELSGPAVSDLLPDGSQQERSNPGSYWIYTDEDLAVPYLPDPMSTGWAVRDAEDLTLLESQHWRGAWPDPQPIRIELVELPEGESRRVELDSTRENVLVVGLAPAVRTELLLSSVPRPDELDLLGPLSWALEHGDGNVLRQLASEGRHWQCTPPRTLVLVHAVQRPLWAPEVLLPTTPRDDAPDGLRAERWRDATDARLRGRLKLHVKSTGQLTVDASWSEWLDAPENPEPSTVDSQGRIASVPVPDWLASQEDGVVEFPFWPKPAPGHDRSREAEPVRHEFGDTKHRYVDYTLTATTRFREYFPLEGSSPAGGGSAISEPELAQTPATARVHVRSTARPAAPRVRSSLPVVRWERTGAQQEGWEHARSVRHGGGIRVWLERPWYSSGDDELLGVVLDRGERDDPAVPAELRPFVSQYGRDPIWETAKPRRGPRIADFDRHDATAEALTLEEPPGSPLFDVAAYKPVFDAVAKGGRGLWSSDIWLPRRAASSYTPFVRLALARYQPWSINDCELSRVTQLDFLQLLPSRILTVDWRDQQTFDVTLSGIAPEGPLEHRVELALEAHDGTTPGDLGWRPLANHGAVPMDEGVQDDDPLVHVIDEPLRLELLRTPRLAFRGAERAPRSQVTAGSPMGAPSIVEAGLVEVAPQLGVDLSRVPVWVLPGQHVWSARVRLPETRALRPQRLVVREFERITSDHEAVKGDVEKAPIGERVVYLETVRLGQVQATGV